MRLFVIFFLLYPVYVNSKTLNWSFEEKLEITHASDFDIIIDKKKINNIKCNLSKKDDFAKISSKSISFNSRCSDSFENGGLFFQNSKNSFVSSFGDEGYVMQEDALFFWSPDKNKMYLMQTVYSTQSGLNCSGLSFHQAKKLMPKWSDDKIKKCIEDDKTRCKKNVSFHLWNKSKSKFLKTSKPNFKIPQREIKPYKVYLSKCF